jgi:hypothetical protein
MVTRICPGPSQTFTPGKTGCSLEQRPGASSENGSSSLADQCSPGYPGDGLPGWQRPHALLQRGSMSSSLAAITSDERGRAETLVSADVLVGSVCRQCDRLTADQLLHRARHRMIAAKRHAEVRAREHGQVSNRFQVNWITIISTWTHRGTEPKGEGTTQISG